MNFVQFHIGDWTSSTNLLTPTERGVYMDLLCLYYSTERPIMRSQCDRMSRAYTPVEREALEYVLREYFREEDGVFYHHRCEEEIDACRLKSEKARSSAKARWNKGSQTAERLKNGSAKCESHTSAHCENDANALRSHSEGNANHKPITNNHINKEKEKEKEIRAAKSGTTAALARPGDVAPQVWTDFLALRRQKRAPLTPTALKRLEAEAGKAGISLSEVLSICCTRGWQSFDASWDWKPKQKPVANVSTQNPSNQDWDNPDPTLYA